MCHASLYVTCGVPESIPIPEVPPAQRLRSSHDSSPKVFEHLPHSSPEDQLGALGRSGSRGNIVEWAELHQDPQNCMWCV